MSEEKVVTGRRVYVTFIHDGCIAVHPSICTGPRYKILNEGSMIFGPKTTAEKIGAIVLRVRDRCKT